MWVIKLGGSLYAVPQLRELLAELVAAVAGQAVIVPGGGRFARQVREQQVQQGFDDQTAHTMALAAMDQAGLMLAALHPRLRPFAGLDEAPGLLRAGAIPVWLPYMQRACFAELPATWQVSSDSLALWLAGQLADSTLLLLKSATAHSRRAHALSRCGLLDGHFPHLLAAISRPALCVNARRLADVRALLDNPDAIAQHCLLTE